MLMLVMSHTVSTIAGILVNQTSLIGSEWSDVLRFWTPHLFCLFRQAFRSAEDDCRELLRFFGLEDSRRGEKRAAQNGWRAVNGCMLPYWRARPHSHIVDIGESQKKHMVKHRIGSYVLPYVFFDSPFLDYNPQYTGITIIIIQAGFWTLLIFCLGMNIHLKYENIYHLLMMNSLFKMI